MVKAVATPKVRGFSLFDLTNDSFQHELLEKALQLAEQDGLGQEEAMEKAIASVDKLTKDKVISYALRILQWESEAEQIAKEMARQAKRKTARENLVEQLKKRLVDLVPHDQVFEDARAKVSFRNYPQMEVPDLTALAEQYLEEVPASKKLADSTKLKKDALTAIAAYEAQVASHIATGMTPEEAAKEAAPVLVKGVIIKENWKVSIK